MNPLPGVVVAQRYRLERPLAAGGMGTIWVARHLQLDIDIAVKFMSDEVDGAPSGRARFEREAKAAARLRSPHVVRTYDYGVDGGTPFLAMELLHGESLEAKLRREAPLALPLTASIFRQIAKGMLEAHDLGIVHRDLKPANIFMARASGEETVKILDFGIAKETKSSIVEDETKSGTLLGSPHHMSPEQARGGVVDARSDLWSLGVVLFRMVTGEKPFAGTNVGDVIAKICADAIPRPSAFRPGLPALVDEFFTRALARNPALRFQSVQEMTLAFDRAIGLPVESTSPTPLSALGPMPEITAREEATRGVEAGAGPEPESTAMGTTSDRAQPSRSLPRSRARTVLAVGVPLAAIVAGFYLWPRAEPTVAVAPAAIAATGTTTAEAAASPPPLVEPSKSVATAEPTLQPNAAASASASASALPVRPVPKARVTATAKPRRSDDPFF
ncbi:MAG: serine/threonine protein kinase [Myxococcales bacterium]|nr:serine/threonine protein kinase [Myxococcales bacterium]